MDIRKNMALSLLLHTLLIIPVFSLAGRVSDGPEASSNCVIVSLLSEMRNMTSHIRDKVKIADTIEVADSPALQKSNSHNEELNIKSADITERKTGPPIPPLNALPEAALEGVFSLHDPGPSGYSPPSKQGDTGQTKDYHTLITAAIEKAKTYPFLARKKKIEGTVIAAFRINEKGHPQDINIRKSSGFEILDSAAMKIVTKAAPFPHVVEPVEIPITFRITD